MLPNVARKIVRQWREPGTLPTIEALFLRLLGLTYLIAFGSLWPQVLGLSGSRGISPAAQMLNVVREGLGRRAYLYVPSFFWLHPSDNALLLFCVLGCLAAVCLAFQVFRQTAAVACFILYLSLVSIGEPFLSFQWDSLLLEAGFLAIFAGAAWLVCAYRLLLFRLMFESGWVKLASHDPNWRNLHALRFHFMTQPLPNPIAYYVAHAPPVLLDAFTGLTLLIELVAPFLLFAPRRGRQAGVVLLSALQICILLTGNYAFFNLLTLALCLWGLDEQTFASIARPLAWRFPKLSQRKPERRRAHWQIASNAAVAGLLILGLMQVLDALEPRGSRPFASVLNPLQPFEIVNGYGLFAVMTTTRPEIILEGSEDGKSWREYSFPYKPGNTHRGLPWVAPYQPRLDWQMWFAALGEYQSNTWVGGLMYRLLTGEPSVYRLINASPFSKPPRYMRALLYQYDFTSSAERARTGAVWRRTLTGIWFGPVSLNGQ